MTARVDAAVGVVADGDETWPLRLDVRTGAAVLIVGEREIAVTPLRWRHKQRLALWAHLGAEFVAAQRTALAVEPGTELDGLERNLVDAVADFLDGEALPYEPGLLAGVAVEACRATGLAPGAFDDRDAVEVELMWRAAATGATPHAGSTSARDDSPAADPWADAISIVFTDPVAPVPAAAPGSTGAGRAGEIPTGAASAPSAADPPTGDDQAGPAGSPVPTRIAPLVPIAPLVHGPEPDHPVRQRSGPRHRITPAPGRPPVGAASAEGAAPVRPALGARPAVGSVRPAVAPVPVPGVAADRPASLAPAAHPGAEGPPPVAGRADATPARPADLFHGPAVAPAPGPRRPEPPVDPAGGPGDVGDGLDALVVAVADRLAEQFAAAADGLGIEV